MKIALQPSQLSKKSNSFFLLLSFFLNPEFLQCTNISFSALSTEPSGDAAAQPRCGCERWLERQPVLVRLLDRTRWGEEQGTDGRIGFRGEMGRWEGKSDTLA